MQDTLEEAFLKAQKEFNPVSKKGINPFYKSAANPNGSPYALYEDIVGEIKPKLHKHGLSYRHSSRVVDGTYLVGSYLVHSATGQRTDPFEMPIPIDLPQKESAGITYAKRVTLGALVGIETDADNDANETVEGAKSNANPVKTQTTTKDDNELITKEDYLELQAAAEVGKWSAKEVYEYMILDYGVDNSSKLKKHQLNSLKKVILSKSFEKAKGDLSHGRA